jgi:uncharacterized protein (TIGR00162 family)
MTWKIKQVAKTIPELKKPVFIEGLPGIGNVGKVAADFIVDNMKAVKLYEIFSYSFPHSVFVNNENLVELPKIEIYYKKAKKQDLILLVGDIQPMDERSCYEFCDELMNIIKKLKCRYIITLGGIGLPKIPQEPKIYCTGNDKDFVARFAKRTKADTDIYGIVGPIIGVTGVLVGIAKNYKVPAVALLAETFGHPLYLGIKSSRELLKVLNTDLNLGIKIKDLDKEIKELEQEMLKKTSELESVSKQTALNKLKDKIKDETSYIG